MGNASGFDTCGSLPFVQVHRRAFIRGAIRRALDAVRRRQRLQWARGTIVAEGHDWDEDPAAWVSAERRSDAGRVG